MLRKYNDYMQFNKKKADIHSPIVDSNCEIVSEIVVIVLFKIRYIEKAKYESEKKTAVDAHFTKPVEGATMHLHDS